MDMVDRLLALLMRLGKLKLVERPMVHEELTISQVEMIAYLIFSHPDGGRIQDIAEGMELSAPTVSVAARRLEEQGWLERQPDPADGRASIMLLTKKSIDLAKKMRQAQHTALERFLQGLNANEQNQLVSLLEAAISAAETRRDENK